MTTLSTDFDLMRSVAAAADTRNDEIRVLLRGFITRMESVPPTVWGGSAAARFQTVVAHWNNESTKLSQALAGIADTIRNNEHQLREAAQLHAQRIAAVTEHL
ncbi:WXG100 family type VII secretion target [Mycolicibacterium rhodesiae]|uniref:WXG100 family type VII secretion target n=1 Tax=Mycolicibacterium rhodesiae TaxID=36814 RepID=A0A1X0IMP4_MYCRH|nr:WXG100 family type VII secretion target [Mycolicibacterium rhodesiae]MCV7347307.1 WXG100 family type VII secretion target [Mycolicibacterium rhodesiae]ORB49519.1 WXG100 family type VII secretion target [Mycolicibacterium rhodesiae]